MVAGGLFLSFAMLTAAVLTLDIQPIGPNQSRVGLATINELVASVIGVNMAWYHITNWLGTVAIIVALGFSALGVTQLVQRKSIAKVDRDIIALGVFYIIIVAIYILFELFIVNYRPVIIETGLEASYPSSHTMIVLCILTTAVMQFRTRIRSKRVQNWVIGFTAVIMAATIIGRVISGVHWATDIAGGILLGSSLVAAYQATLQQIEGATADTQLRPD